MTKSQIDAVALFAAMAAAALALMIPAAPFAWLTSIAGLVLLFVLFSFDAEGYRSVSQSLAFSAVCGFCVVVAALTALRILTLQGSASASDTAVAADRLATEWLPLTWAAATLIFWAIDRARMKARQTVSPVYGDAVATTPVSSVSKSETRPRRGLGLTYEGPRTATTPNPAPVLVPEPAPVAVPQPVVPAAAPARPLKEAMIYVGLVGEGLNVMRSVRAEHIGRDFYRIIDEMPTDEQWEYLPGQVVRCQKKRLSSGKALVATEEAPRQP